MTATPVLAGRAQGAAMGARIGGVAVHLPERRMSDDELELTLGPYRPPPGIVARLTGITAQLVTALELGRAGPGDLVALVGPVGGVPPGIMVIRL